MCRLIAAEDVWDPRAPGEHKYLHQYHTSCGQELDKGRCSLCLFHAADSLANILCLTITLVLQYALIFFSFL